jgi:hypothetical protein
MAIKVRTPEYFLTRPLLHRKMELHAPIYCYLCTEEIEIGEHYYSGRGHFAAHKTCVDKHIQ